MVSRRVAGHLTQRANVETEPTRFGHREGMALEFAVSGIRQTSSLLVPDWKTSCMQQSGFWRVYVGIWRATLEDVRSFMCSLQGPSGRNGSHSRWISGLLPSR